MAKIILVRHGQDADNAIKILNGHRDTELTELGKSQAKNTAQLLENEKIDHIYHSPLKRTTQTAKIIAEHLGHDSVMPHDDLIERDFGVMTGKAVDDIKKLENVIETEQVTYFLDPEGAETFDELLLRAKKVLDYMNKKHPDETVLIVTHGDIGKMIRAAHEGWNWQEALHSGHFGNAEAIILEKNK